MSPSKRIITIGSLTAFFVVVSLTASADDADAKAKELEKFQGTWLISSGERGGVALPEKKATKLVIKGSKLKVFVNGKEDNEQEIAIDPSKNPKHLDLTRLLNGQQHTTKGIYAFEKGTLRLCGDDTGEERPTEFSTKDKRTFSLLVLKRE